MRADWNFIAGIDELDELSSAVTQPPTEAELETSLSNGGRHATFSDRLLDAGLMDEAENLFGLLLSRVERQNLPLLRGLTWPRWMRLLEDTTVLPNSSRFGSSSRIPKPIPLRETGKWKTQLTVLGTTRSGSGSTTLSAPGSKRSTGSATLSS